MYLVALLGQLKKNSELDMTKRELRHRRRLVIAAVGTAAATIGGLIGGSRRTDAQPLTPANSKRSAGAQEQWFDKPHALHRILFDTTTADGLGQALAFADVYFSVNKTSYDTDADDLAVLIVLHHFSTPFGFDDAIWAKYGTSFSEKKYKQELVDPRTKRAPALNLYNAKAMDSLPNGGVTLDSLSERGARFAVCDTATRGIANMLSKLTHESSDAIYAELTGHLIRNAVLVPAGITTINRAQELGYSYSVAV